MSADFNCNSFQKKITNDRWHSDSDANQQIVDVTKRIWQSDNVSNNWIEKMYVEAYTAVSLQLAVQYIVRYNCM